MQVGIGIECRAGSIIGLLVLLDPSWLLAKEEGGREELIYGQEDALAEVGEKDHATDAVGHDANG